MGEPDVIKPLTVKQAAARLGRSEMRVHDMIGEGKLRPITRHPIGLLVDDIEQLRQTQHDGAVEEFVARGVDLARLARDTRRQIRPLPMDPFRGGERGVTSLPPKVRDLFGPAALVALTLLDRDECCWCAARVAAGLLRVPAPKYGEVMLGLLGNPCREKCMPRFAGEQLGKLRARVHPGGTAAPGGRSEPSAGKRPAVPSQAAQRAANDNGKTLIARRRREVTARLKTARRDGDTQYAAKLMRQLQSLVADARVVDGRRTFSAADRPGTLRCGHELAARCSCPRRASKRAGS